MAPVSLPAQPRHGGPGPAAPATPGSEAVEVRRRAVAELGSALRGLVDAAVRSEVPAHVLTRVARQITEHVAPLAAARREPGVRPAINDRSRLRWFYNPAVGEGNPLAPPMTIEIVDGEGLGRVRVGLAHQGPPGYVHGGVSALLLDQLLSDTLIAVRGGGGVTASLSLRYRRPVPLDTDLVLRGRVVGEAADQAGKVTTRGTIATAADPDRILVEADAVFVQLRADQRHQLFRR